MFKMLRHHHVNPQNHATLLIAIARDAIRMRKRVVRQVQGIALARSWAALPRYSPP
jgi:hypothetical protein